jgi:hypothetical protein
VPLGRLANADQLLRDCQDILATVRHITQLAAVYGACADLEDKRHTPRKLSTSNAPLVPPTPVWRRFALPNIINYLSRIAWNSPEQWAHRLAAALLLHHLSRNPRGLARTLLPAELHNDTHGPEPLILPRSA